MDKLNLNFGSVVSDMLSKFASALPNIIGALAVFIIGWIIAKFVANILKKILKSVGIDKLADKLNEIEIVEKSNIKIVPSKLLSKIAYYVLLIIFTVAATDVLNMPAVSNLMSDLLNYIPNLISALIFLAIGIFLAEFVKNIVQTATSSLGIPSGRIIASVVFYFIFLNVLISALGQAKINTAFIEDNLTTIIAGVVFAFALGYGLASKSMMANMLASFYSKKKFNVGDKIKINDISGEITEMDNSSITLASNEKKFLIPLSRLMEEDIEFIH